jgi:ADP-ribose pyrophosphatase YjhB (NUDIX family)
VHLARVAGYRAFYRLPGRWRHRLVRWLKPRYTLGAVVMVHADDAEPPGQLLLLRQPPGKGWSLPGGLMNRNETPAACASRELTEETGIRLAPEELVPATPNAMVHSDGSWVDMIFEAKVPADTPTVIDGAEVLEAAFHPLDTLPPLTAATARLLAKYGIGPYSRYPEIRDR